MYITTLYQPLELQNCIPFCFACFNIYVHVSSLPVGTHTCTCTCRSQVKYCSVATYVLQVVQVCRNTYGTPSSVQLLRICLPTKMIPSWMVSSRRQPQVEHSSKRSPPIRSYPPGCPVKLIVENRKQYLNEASSRRFVWAHFPLKKAMQNRDEQKLTNWNRYILVMKLSSYSVWVRWSSAHKEAGLVHQP